MTARRLASLGEAAAHASVSIDTIRRRIADGSLAGFRLGNKIIRVDLDELDACFKRVPSSLPQQEGS